MSKNEYLIEYRKIKESHIKQYCENDARFEMLGRALIENCYSNKLCAPKYIAKQIFYAGTEFVIQRDNCLQKPVYGAIENNHLELLEFLIELKADLSGTLHHAAKYGKWSPIKLLVDSNVDINEQDSLGNTPLHAAINASNIGDDRFIFIEELLKMGARIDILNFQRESPLFIATSSIKDVYILLKKYPNTLNMDKENLDRSLESLPLDITSPQGGEYNSPSLGDHLEDDCNI